MHDHHVAQILDEKTCRKCGEVKPVSEFHPRPESRDGYRNDCKPCHRARCAARRGRPGNAERQRQQSAEWYQRNKERHAENRRRWTEENREKVLADSRAYAAAHREEARKRASQWAKENPERHRRQTRKGNWHFRAKSVGGPLESFFFEEIYERDEGICGICFESVPFELATLDHVIPFTRGGMHQRANVQVAHRRCNIRKGNRLPFDREKSHA